MKKQIIEDGNVYEVSGFISSSTGEIMRIIERDKLEEIINELYKYSEILSMYDTMRDVVKDKYLKFSVLYEENKKSLCENRETLSDDIVHGYLDRIHNFINTLKRHVTLYNDEYNENENFVYKSLNTLGRIEQQIQFNSYMCRKGELKWFFDSPFLHI